MDKVKINIVGGETWGAHKIVCCSPPPTGIPKHIEWAKDGSGDVSIYIDNHMRRIPDKSKRNFGWICEGSSIVSPLISWLPNNIPFLEDNYELIFTHDKRLLPLSKKFKFAIAPSVPWVVNRKIHPKSKLVSMISSNKNFTHGHRYRHQIMQKFKHQIDLFGTGHNRIENKEDGLIDYYFSIAMENDSYSNGFTEKITDCFATGTIPIYWGSPDIGDFFNRDGIIFLSDNFKIEDLSIELYNSKMEYIIDNFKRSINLPTVEDYMYENYIK